MITHKTFDLFCDVNIESESTDFSRPFVYFRLPSEKTIHCWSSDFPVESLSMAAVLSDGSGDRWVIAPFNFYRTEQVLSFKASQKTSYPNPDAFHADLILPHQKQIEIGDTSAADFKTWVAKAAHAMQNAAFTKTALSKVRVCDLQTNYNWAHWFSKACALFPHALVFFVHVPGVHTWAGATPELFLSYQAGLARSVALAGTLHPDSDSNWSAKEREEQAFVTEYIRSVFSSAGFSTLNMGEPQTISIGQLKHLKTTFEVDTDWNPAHISQLIQALHPTPAVGGMPKKEGLDFIANHETHDRLWYSGFVGPVTNKSFQFYVNLRSMLVESNRAVLFAGAGITAQSEPENEWLETENKLRMNMDLLK